MQSKKEAPAIPWSKCFYETLSVFRKPDKSFLIFLFLFFLLSIPNQSDLPDRKELDPFHFWLWGSAVLAYVAASYYVYIAFLSWVKDRSDHQHKPEVIRYFKTANELMLPLTILSIRGAILASLGIICLVLPGIYYYFKYQLAAFCLIFEGWREELPPIKRAEQLIKTFGLSLIFLVFLASIELSIPWILEYVASTNSNSGSYFLRFAITIVETGITLFFDLYFALLVLFLLNRSRKLA